MLWLFLSLSLQFGGQEFAKELHSLLNTRIVDFFLENSCFLVVSTSKLFICQSENQKSLNIYFLDFKNFFKQETFLSDPL